MSVSERPMTEFGVSMTTSVVTTYVPLDRGTQDAVRPTELVQPRYCETAASDDSDKYQRPVVASSSP